jgi:hypothetical protein
MSRERWAWFSDSPEVFASEDQRAVPGERPRRADEVDALTPVARQRRDARRRPAPSREERWKPLEGR